jgi:hypothetical protein
MRIERIRRLIWGVDVLLLLAIGAYFYLNLLQPDPPYDDPNQWARDRRTRERAPIREARAWSDFGWVVTFPKDGLKPPPPVEEVAEGEPTEKKSSLERDWTLITFTRVIDTDEALVILKSKADGSEVPLAIGSKVPGSAWRLRDLDEEGKAVFQLDGETEISILEIQEKEYGGEGGEFTPTEPGGVAAGSPGTGPGGRPDRNVRPGLDAVEVRPGTLGARAAGARLSERREPRPGDPARGHRPALEEPGDGPLRGDRPPQGQGGLLHRPARGAKGRHPRLDQRPARHEQGRYRELREEQGEEREAVRLEADPQRSAHDLRLQPLMASPFWAVDVGNTRVKAGRFAKRARSRRGSRRRSGHPRSPPRRRRRGALRQRAPRGAPPRPTPRRAGPLSAPPGPGHPHPRAGTRVAARAGRARPPRQRRRRPGSGPRGPRWSRTWERPSRSTPWTGTAPSAAGPSRPAPGPRSAGSAPGRRTCRTPGTSSRPGSSAGRPRRRWPRPSSLGFAGLVDRLLEEAAEALGGVPALLLTGGGAEALRDRLRTAPELVPHLTLTGIRILARGGWRARARPRGGLS